MARGIVLIVAAVVLGLVLLNATDGPEEFRTTSGTGQDDGDDGSTDGTAGGGSDTPATTDTTAVTAARPPGEVTVLVANAADVPGAAARLSQVVADAGYKTAPPANAPTAEASAVYFVPGYEADANAVAALLDPAPAVSPMPDPVPVEDLRGAQVLVVQARDLAG